MKIIYTVILIILTINYASGQQEQQFKTDWRKTDIKNAWSNISKSVDNIIKKFDDIEKLLPSDEDKSNIPKKDAQFIKTSIDALEVSIHRLFNIKSQKIHLIIDDELQTFNTLEELNEYLRSIQ